MELKNVRDSGLQRRIDAMFARDRIWAFGFVIALWLVVGLVLFEVDPYITSDAIRYVSWISALILLIFNTLLNVYANEVERILLSY